MITLNPDTQKTAALAESARSSKRGVGGREDVVASEAATGEPLFQIVTREDFPIRPITEVRHPMLARAARPGQFVIALSHQRGERIPLTIADFDLQKGTVTLVIQAVGKTTREMQRMSWRGRGYSVWLAPWDIRRRLA